MNLNNSVTHCIAAETRGVLFRHFTLFSLFFAQKIHIFFFLKGLSFKLQNVMVMLSTTHGYLIVVHTRNLSLYSPSNYHITLYMYMPFCVNFQFDLLFRGYNRYFLVISESSKKKLQEEIDEFSDSYFMDIDIKDLKQVIRNKFVASYFPLFLNLIFYISLIYGSPAFE